MRFLVLGPVEVAADGRRLRLGSAHQRLILAVLLASRGEVVSPDRLIDAVWHGRPPTSARKSLHSHVSRLRRVLAVDGGAPDALVTEAEGYRFALPKDSLDAVRFEASVARARRHGEADPRQAAAELGEALAMWRGRAFGELASHGLVRAEAVRLDELRAAAIADRLDARLAIGEHQAVLGELEAIVAADPLAERPHAQLMLALYRSGRQADALAVHRRLQQRLRDEVGVDPSPELQRLQERILRQDANLALEPSAPGVHATEPPSATVDGRGPSGSARRSELFGRDEDIDEVAGLVTSSLLVTLTGPGGVGKSRLAGEVAVATRHRFDDGVVTCGLAAVRDPASVPDALAESLGLQHQGDRPSAALVLEALGTRRLLLVLDNCEHLLEAMAPLVERIRERCPNVAVLATSREYLRLAGERVREVAPLPVPPLGASAAEVAATPAGRLLCARAQQVEPSFELTAANAATVAQLCRLLDGIPLAIELAAARTRALALDAIVDRIDDRFEVLTGGPHAAGGRHRTLQAMVSWSYELLTDAEARLFDRLSVFAGSFTLAAAEQVCAGDPLAPRQVAGVLAELVDKSLVAVHRADGEISFRLLDTLRAFGAERLEASDATERFRRAHAAYHVELVERLAPDVRGPDEQAPLALIDAVLDDLRLAHAWSRDEDLDAAMRLPAALDDDLVFRPRVEVFGWAEQALALPGASGHPAYPVVMAVAARAALNRGELDDARRLASSALAAVAPDAPSALSPLYVLTTVALYQGDLDVALLLADRRLAIADATGQPFHRALAGVSRVLALRYRGDVEEAVQAAAVARDDARSSGNHTAQAWALYSSGETLLDTDPDAAADLLEGAIATARQVDRRFIEGVALVSLASLHGRAGRTGPALELFRATIVHWRSLGVPAQQLTTLRNLVELLTRVGAPDAGAVVYGAVTAGGTPSFGTEADRLAAAWEHLESELGSGAAHAASQRGRRLTLAEVVDRALSELDGLLAARP